MYKRIFALLAILCLCLSGCGSEQRQEPETNDLGEFTNTAVAVTLPAGTYSVPDDIRPGHYIVKPALSTDGDYGRFNITDSDGLTVMAATLSNAYGFGVDKCEVYLEDGDTVTISRLSEVDFEPSDPSVSLYAGSGIYYVGWDIPSGQYIAKITEGTGNFVVYDAGGELVVNETSEEGDEIELNLKDGYKIEIMGITKVEYDFNY